MTVLDETVLANDTGHIADHAVLKAGYDARGASPAIAAFTTSTTPAQHVTIHNALHAEHVALGAGSLPQNATTGHLSHHNALAVAHNARNAAAPTFEASQTLYTSQTPANSANDATQITVATRFRPDHGGRIMGVRFYAMTTMPGSAIGLIYSDAGTELGRVTFGAVSAGWNTATFATPVTVTANTVYRMSVWTDGQYVYSAGGFPFNNGHLSGIGGAYVYGASAAFPSNTTGSRYFVDPVYQASTADELPAGFPNASNTGPTIALTALNSGHSGTNWTSNGTNITITGNNATISGYDIPGIIYNPVAQYTGLLIQNCKIRGIGEADWIMRLGSGSQLLDCEIGGGADGTTYSRAVAVYTGGPGNLIKRCNIHHFISSVRMDGGSTLEDSFIHDLPMGDPVLNLSTGLYDTTDHSGGAMTTRGANNITRHCSFKGGNTANLFVQSDVTDATAVVGSYLIENNLFQNDSKNGEVSSFGVAIETRTGNVGPFTVQNNTFSFGWQVGPYAVPTGTTVSGNVYVDGSSAD